MSGADGNVGILWGLRGEQVLVCFRVTVDASGRVVAVTMVDLHDLNGRPDCDEAVRLRLRERYGEELEVLVVRDGGASFEEFQRDLRQGQEPSPHRQIQAEPPGDTKQLGLWNPET